MDAKYCGTGKQPAPKAKGPPKPFNKAAQLAKAQALRKGRPMPPAVADEE